jgi:hypothetical protein
MAQPFAVGSLAERAHSVRAATVGVAALLALSCWACKPEFHQALPPDVEAHFAAANSWDVYQISRSEETFEPGRPLVNVAGYVMDATSRKVTVEGEKLSRLRSAVRVGMEATRHNPPAIVAALGGDEFLVAASHGEREMALVFEFWPDSPDGSQVAAYCGTPTGVGWVNTDTSARPLFLELFAPAPQERAR